MGLFNFIEQHHGIRPAPNRFGQISALFVTDITRRGTDKSGNRVFFHVLRHVDSDNGLVAVEYKFCQGFGQLGFPDTGRAHKNKRSDGPVGVLQTGACPPYGVGYCLHGFTLPDHVFVEACFHMDQLFSFAFKHFAYRYTGPAGNNFGHILIVYLFFKHFAVLLKIGKFLIGLFQARLQFCGSPITDFCHFGQIAVSFSQLGFYTELLLLFFDFAYGLDQVFFILPMCFHLGQLGIHIGKIFVQFSQSVPGGRIGFFFERLTLNFGLSGFTLNFINFHRHAVNFDPQLRSALIDQINGLIR